MKTCLVFFFAYLLVVQGHSASFRPVRFSTFSTYQLEDNEFFIDEMGNIISNVGQGINNAATATVNGVTGAVTGGVHMIGGAFNWGYHVVGGVVHYSYNQIAAAAAKGYSRAAMAVKNTYVSALAFQEVVEAWKTVDWRTGRNMMFAIQVTARDCRNFYVALNQLTGGKLNDVALRYAEGLAVGVFPPSLIIIESGKVIYKVSGQVKDITQLVHSIETDIQTKNWAQLAVDAFKLFKIIYSDL